MRDDAVSFKRPDRRQVRPARAGVFPRLSFKFDIYWKQVARLVNNWSIAPYGLYCMANKVPKANWMTERLIPVEVTTNNFQNADGSCDQQIEKTDANRTFIGGRSH